MNKPQQIFQIIQNMGWRYFFFRAWFEVKKRSGLLKKTFPVSPPFMGGISLAEWKKIKKPFFFSDRNELAFSKINKEKLKGERFPFLMEIFAFLIIKNAFLVNNIIG